jgi:hypothetical protein
VHTSLALHGTPHYCRASIQGRHKPPRSTESPAHSDHQTPINPKPQSAESTPPRSADFGGLTGWCADVVVGVGHLAADHIAIMYAESLQSIIGKYFAGVTCRGYSGTFSGVIRLNTSRLFFSFFPLTSFVFMFQMSRFTHSANMSKAEFHLPKINFIHIWGPEHVSCCE